MAPLAGLGRHANGRLAVVGEHLGREMTGETLAEGAAGLVTGQGASLEDLARAAVSGVSGAATGQVDNALHQRLDGRMAALDGITPTSLSGAADLAPGADTPAPDTLGASAPEPATAGTQVAGTRPGSEATSSQMSGPESGPIAAASVGPPSVDGPVVQDAPSPAVPYPASATSASIAVDPVSSPHSSAAPDAGVTPTLSSTAVEPRLASPLPASVEAGPAHAAASVDTPPRSAVLPEPLVAANRAPVTAAVSPLGSQAPAPQAAAGGAAPVSTESPRTGGSDPITARSVAGTLSPPAVPTTASPPTPVGAPTAPERDVGPPAPGPEPSPSPSPRSPLLEALAPGPQRHTDDASPILPGPIDPRPPRPKTPEQLAAHRAADREGLDRRRYQSYFEAQRAWFEDRRRQEEAAWLRTRADRHQRSAGEYGAYAQQLHEAGHDPVAQRWRKAAFDASTMSYELQERAYAVLNGSVVPEHVTVDDDADFYRINDDVADLAPGAVETSDRSGLTGDDDPPPIDRSRRFGVRGGLRPPLALHQTDLERQMPRNPDGSVVRTADPRSGGWFRLANDGGPQADATPGINCLDCTLSLYDTWVHGRPRVSAPRTFDA